MYIQRHGGTIGPPRPSAKEGQGLNDLSADLPGQEAAV